MHVCMHDKAMHIFICFSCMPVFSYINHAAYVHIACMKAGDAVDDEAPTTTPSFQA